MEGELQAIGDILSEGICQQPNSRQAVPSQSIELEQDWNCLICMDQLWVQRCDCPEGNELYGALERCECMKEHDRIEKQKRLLRYCQLPRGAADMTFGTFDVRRGLKEAYEAAKELASGNGVRWLTIISKTDRGKSHLAVAVAQEWLARGVPARYSLVPRLLDELRRGYDPRSELSYEREFDILCDTPLLILDDLGMENPTPWVQEKLETLLEIRAANNMYLMVTSNIGIEEMTKRIGSRLQRVKPGKVIVIDAPSYNTWRGKKKGE